MMCRQVTTTFPTLKEAPWRLTRLRNENNDDAVINKTGGRFLCGWNTTDRYTIR